MVMDILSIIKSKLFGTMKKKRIFIVDTPPNSNIISHIKHLSNTVDVDVYTSVQKLLVKISSLKGKPTQYDIGIIEQKTGDGNQELLSVVIHNLDPSITTIIYSEDDVNESSTKKFLKADFICNKSVDCLSGTVGAVLRMNS